MPQPLIVDDGLGRGVWHKPDRAGKRVSSRIVLEITERSLARPEMIRRGATRLRDLGFSIALDEGIGSAGLEIPRPAPVDYRKIDRALIAGAPVHCGLPRRRAPS